MIVFNYYLKVAKSYIGVIIMYTVIFLGIAIITTTSGSNESNTFTASKAKIAVVNQGEDTLFIETFKDYIVDNAELVTLDEDQESLKDALFFRKVDYIMIIPKGYTEDFLASKDTKIEVLSVPDSVSAIYSKQIMNQYLNIASLYVAADISVEELATKVKNDLANQATVTLASKEASKEVAEVNAYYSFANYIFIAITLSVVNMIMISFTEDKVKNRNLVSSLSYKKINRQLLSGNLLFSLAIWLLYVVISFILYPTTMTSTYGLLFIGNSLTFMTTILAIAFLIATITNNRSIIGILANVISLGSSFIAGSFVPQEMLGSFVLNISKVTPSYWYIKNNGVINSLITFDYLQLQPYLINIGIILMFTIGIIVISQFVGKLKLKK